MAQLGTSKPLTIYNLTLGDGHPKICIPVMGRNETEVLASADAALSAKPDLVEWRLDYLTDLSQKNLDPILVQLRRTFEQIPLLVTFRTKAEGGQKELDPMDYTNLLSRVIVSGLADLVDVELFSGAAPELIECAHRNRVRVICSNHDFQHTPTEEELLERMERMCELGCDIPKIAVMPQNNRDVLTLLSATAEMNDRHPGLPIITMSMGSLGAVSRVSSALFGSAVTFGCAGQASAPGQIPAKQLREILSLLDCDN